MLRCPIKKIKSAGVKAGIAIDLDTHVGDASEDLARIIEQCDSVLIMSVKAGKSGQVFNGGGLAKVSRVKKINPAVKVTIDGGINVENIARAKKAGVSVAVVGRAIYKQSDRKGAVNSLINAMQI
jgi:ribulose-phosphate 3-epimerase